MEPADRGKQPAQSRAVLPGNGVPGVLLTSQPHQAAVKGGKQAPRH